MKNEFSQKEKYLEWNKKKEIVKSERRERHGALKNWPKRYM